jgi:bifunctional UDP-N-acetylglucosamine pyrophosphorylase / glucosamine-1-phosphate N-acetyltransferase
MNTSVIILAAGQGKRMRSDFPKVLHPLGGLPLLQHVITVAQTLTSQIYVIYGHEGESVRSSLSEFPVHWVHQKEQRGTGHAVAQAINQIPDDDRVLILLGDCPLITANTLKHLYEMFSPEESGIGLITTILENATGYGRILRNNHGYITRIIEEKDASEEQRAIHEVNTGIFLVSAHLLKTWLPQLKNNNQQNEYYLTDIISMALAENYSAHTYCAPNSHEFLGVNDRIQLAAVERIYQKKQITQLMLDGVSFADPSRVDIRGEKTQIGKDCFVDINVLFEGTNKIGEHVHIGAHCILKNVVIHDHAVIEPYTSIEGAEIESHAAIGPFARIRPGTHIQQHAKVGNFVELKKTTLGAYSKANHLSYLGDAIIGTQVNIGAGTITCNYDGQYKHPTHIEDNVFVGSGTQLVAPITLHQGAYIGAGSTINKDAPPQQLTVARSKQISLHHWKKQDTIESK